MSEANDDELAHPRCPDCRTVMRDDARGFRCDGCGHIMDLSAELDAVVMPPDFDGPAIQGG